MKRIGFVYFFLVFLLCGFVPLQAAAADISVTATVDKTTVSLEDYILLSITVKGTDAEPSLAGLDDFQVSSRGRTSRMSFINGQMSSSYEFNYVLQPLKSGTFTIGPFEVVHKKKAHTSNTITLTVSKSPPRSADTGRDVYVTAGVDKHSSYVYEQIIYSFKFYRRVQVSKANLSLAPDFEGFISERLGEEREYQRVINGQTYSVTELRWALFPIKTGVLTVGASALDCELIIKDNRRRGRRFGDPFFDDSFFGFGTRTQRKSLRTEPLTVMIHQLPADGQPDGFSQLVGEFELNGSLGETSVHAGESATLTLRLRGNGSMHGMKTIDLPALPGVKVYDDKPVLETDQSGKQLRGTLTVKKAIVPMEKGDLMIPAVGVSYFDPAEKQYKIARAGPFNLSVLPARQSEALQAVVPGMNSAPKENVQVLGQDIRPIYTGFDVIEPTSPPRLRSLHYALGLAPFCLYVLFILAYSIRVHRLSDSTRARARSAWPRFKKQLPGLRSALKDSDSDFYGEAARCLREFVGDMFGVAGAALTTAEIRELLVGAGVRDELVVKIEHILGQCDAGRYGSALKDMSPQEDLFKELTRTARELHRSR